MLGRFTLRDQGNFPSRFIKGANGYSYYCCYWKDYDIARRLRCIVVDVVRMAIRPNVCRQNK
jgi:hypothetical protein